MAELGSMGADELRDWEAYFRLEPWGEERMDLRFATLTAVVLNKLRWGKGEKPVEIADLMPDFEGVRVPEEPEPVSPEEAREQALALCRALNGE